MKIIYVHHGNRKIENPPSQKDDLTELGYKDCQLVSELFKHESIKNSLKAIFTSSFFRCTKTAEIINQFHNVPIIKDNRLNEFKSFKNETWTQAQTRIINCIDDIIEKYNDEDTIICVTSGVNLGAFICKSFGIVPSESTPFLGVASCSPIIFNYKKI